MLMKNKIYINSFIYTIIYFIIYLSNSVYTASIAVAVEVERNHFKWQI